MIERSQEEGGGCIGGVRAARRERHGEERAEKEQHSSTLTRLRVGRSLLAPDLARADHQVIAA